jgi:hypothetical protein
VSRRAKTPGNQADQSVGVGEVFVEITEKKQAPGSWFFRRGELALGRAKKTARGEKEPRTCTLEDQKLAACDRLIKLRERKCKFRVIGTILAGGWEAKWKFWGKGVRAGWR